MHAMNSCAGGGEGAASGGFGRAVVSDKVGHELEKEGADLFEGEDTGVVNSVLDLSSRSFEHQCMPLPKSILLRDVLGEWNRRVACI